MTRAALQDRLAEFEAMEASLTPTPAMQALEDALNAIEVQHLQARQVELETEIARAERLAIMDDFTRWGEGEIAALDAIAADMV